MRITNWHQAQQVVEELLRVPRDSRSDEHIDRLEDMLMEWLRSQMQPIIARHVYNASLREDALQETLTDLFLGLRTYDPARAPFEVWAKQVAVYASYRVLKRYQHSVLHEVVGSQLDTLDEDAPEWQETLAAPDDPEQEAIERERAHYLMECARRALCDDEFLVWIGMLQENSYENLAQLLGKRPDALRQQFKRARAKVLAEAVLHPNLFTSEEIWAAINRCQQSAEPLTEREMAAMREVIGESLCRRPPSYRNIQYFRDACVKIAPYLKQLISLVAVLLCYGASSGIVAKVPLM